MAERDLRLRNRLKSVMGRDLHYQAGPRYNEDASGSGAQTERRGEGLATCKLYWPWTILTLLGSRPSASAVPERNFSSVVVRRQSTGGQHLAVGAEGDAGDRAAVLVQGHQFLSASNVPQNHFARYSAGQGLAIRREGEVPDLSMWVEKAVALLARGKV